MLGGIIITQIEVITVNRREKLYIFMKHEDVRYHELRYVHRLVRFIIEVSETHVLKYIE